MNIIASVRRESTTRSCIVSPFGLTIALCNDELFRAPHTRGGTIIVGCHDGIVELTGSVDNLLAKDRAVAVTEVVKGVRAVSDRIRVEPMARADFDTKRDVRDALSWDPTTKTYPVNVDTAGGVVRLTGAVDSWAERRLAERQARGVRGANKVHVTVQKGKATLTGTVDTWTERRAATEGAYGGGAIAVDNQLNVG
jgi:osmotically-inducible protein OsmY